MVANKIVCNVSLNFILSQFIEAVLVTIVAIVFVFFVDALSITITISSHSVTEVSTIVFKYGYLNTILTNTYARIPTIILFVCTIIL